MTFFEIEKLAKYLNTINRGKFTDGELHEQAQDLWYEYKTSKENGELTNAMKSLCEEILQVQDFIKYMDYVAFMRNIETLSQMDSLLADFVKYIREN